MEGGFTQKVVIDAVETSVPKTPNDPSAYSAATVIAGIRSTSPNMFQYGGNRVIFDGPV